MKSKKSEGIKNFDDNMQKASKDKNRLFFALTIMAIITRNEAIRNQLISPYANIRDLAGTSFYAKVLNYREVDRMNTTLVYIKSHPEEK